MQSGIYKIENSLNGKRYIGSAVHLRERINNHRTRLNCGIHKNRHLQSAWNKHGASSFTFTPIIFCSPDDLLFYEQRCIDGYNAVNTGYNISPVAGNTRGRAPNSERNAKMAATKRGKKQTPEWVAARLAWRLDPVAKARAGRAVSAALKGKPKSPQHIANAAAAQRGKVLSAETKEKLRLINLGKKHGPRSPQARANLREGQRKRRAREGTTRLIQLT